MEGRAFPGLPATTPGEAVRLQKELAFRVIARDAMAGEIHLVAGVDVSAGRAGETGRAAVVVLRYPEMEVAETSVAEGPPGMPYIPGLLSFRELPLIMPALERLKVTPDLLLVDGQGIAHPRRLGLAAHLGVITGLPAIGCAKSRLCGVAGEQGPERGDTAELTDGGEVIGRVVRTRTGCRPVFVSVGHRISLETAVDWVLKLGGGYRLPEPLRLAHRAAAGTGLTR